MTARVFTRRGARPGRVMLWVYRRQGVTPPHMTTERPDWATLAGVVVPYRWRWYHRAHARFYGLFWSPCPACGREFGGHEWGGSVEHDDGRGSGVCIPCTLSDPERYDQTGRMTGRFDDR